MSNKEKEIFWYKTGDLVYIISPLTSQLQTTFRKISGKYIGPIVVDMIIVLKLFYLAL